MKRRLAYFCLYRCLDAEHALYWVIDLIRWLRGKIVVGLYRDNQTTSETRQ